MKKRFVILAAGGLMLLAATPARAGVQFPYYPVNNDGCSGESECLGSEAGGKWLAGADWQMAAEEDRRKCTAENPAAGLAEGNEMYLRLEDCLMHERDKRKTPTQQESLAEILRDIDGIQRSHPFPEFLTEPFCRLLAPSAFAGCVQEAEKAKIVAYNLWLGRPDKRAECEDAGWLGGVGDDARVTYRKVAACLGE